MKLQKTLRLFSLAVLGMAALPVIGAEDSADENAPAALFEKLDADKDGKLTKDEVGKERERFFNRLLRVADKDEDGTLTKAEFLAGNQPAERPVQPGNGFGDRRPQRGGFSDEMFNRLDQNRDGKLTLKELPEQARERMKPLFDRLKKEELTKDDLKQAFAGGNQGGNRGGSAEGFFKRLDTDGDGKLTLKEAPEQGRQMVKGLLQRAGKGEDGSLTLEEFQRHIRGGNPGQRPGFAGPAILRALDANKDGKLSKEELAKAADQFDKLDQNKDGSLDGRELMGFGGRPGMAQGTNPAQQRGVEEFAKRSMERLDKNKDGKLSGDEIPADLKERLLRHDANKDGEVTQEEFLAGVRRFGGQNRRPSERPKNDRRPSKPKSDN